MNQLKEMVCYSKTIFPFLPLSLIGIIFDIKCENKQELEKESLVKNINHSIMNILQNNSQTASQQGNVVQGVNINYSPNIPNYLKELRNKNGKKMFGCKPRVQQTTDMRFKIIQSNTTTTTNTLTTDIKNTIKGYLEQKGAKTESINKYLGKYDTNVNKLKTDIEEKINQSITQTSSQEQYIDYTDNIGRCDEDGKGKVLKQNAVVEMLASSIISSVFKNVVDIKEFHDIELEIKVQKEPGKFIKGMVIFIDFILPILIVLIIIFVMYAARTVKENMII